MLENTSNKLLRLIMQLNSEDHYKLTEEDVYLLESIHKNLSKMEGIIWSIQNTESLLKGLK